MIGFMPQHCPTCGERWKNADVRFRVQRGCTFTCQNGHSWEATWPEDPKEES